MRCGGDGSLQEAREGGDVGGHSWKGGEQLVRGREHAGVRAWSAERGTGGECVGDERTELLVMSGIEPVT
jgi:hypothetical protein